jgi:hypothetical protein
LTVRGQVDEPEGGWGLGLTRAGEGRRTAEQHEENEGNNGAHLATPTPPVAKHHQACPNWLGKA